MLSKLKLMTLMGMLLAFNVQAQTIVLTNQNSLVMNQVIDVSSVGKLMKEASEIDSPIPSNEPIYLVLYTPGGSIDDGLQAIEYLKNLNRPVHTITMFSASMGFQTVEGLGTRYITENGTLMAHKAKGGINGEIPGQIQSRLVWILRMVERLDDKTVSRTGGKLTKKDFQDMYENEMYLDGQDAVDAGLADTVVNVRCDDSLKATHSEVISFFGFNISLEMANCPMNQGIVSVGVELQTTMGLMSLSDFFKKGGGFGEQGRTWESTAPTLTNPLLTIETIEKEKDHAKQRYIANRNNIVRY